MLVHALENSYYRLSCLMSRVNKIIRLLSVEVERLGSGCMAAVFVLSFVQNWLMTVCVQFSARVLIIDSID